ncbi:f-box domain-containing protein [Colletotrichum incanum]|uniref:F-box domain-containing protein n=1 Tax=Colletotrichum incanum TaxID=1573173 RepID=A0A166ZM15_COLIC|nr:f-box domain-containing protein [Colletotrichum incanum]
MPVNNGSNANQVGRGHGIHQRQSHQAGTPAPLVDLAQGHPRVLSNVQGQPLAPRDAITLAQVLSLSPHPLGQTDADMPTIANSGSAGGALNAGVVPFNAVHAGAGRSAGAPSRRGEVHQRQYHPMRIVVQPVLRYNNSELERAFRQARGFSDQYRGDIFNDRNMSADIPAHQSTSLWMEGLPAGCTPQLLLGAIAQVGPTGKIWASYINPANAADNKPHAAAKVVFFSREGAEILLRASQAGMFLVGDRRPRVTWNRIRTAPRSTIDSHKSRVVFIYGPAQYVNQPRLSQWFRGFFRFESEVVIPRDYRVKPGGQAVQLLEWRFASTRCQGEAAFMAIGLELRGMVECRYG